MLRFAAPFESRLRLILFGLLLAALLLQGATALVLKRSREATESALLTPLSESLDRMQVRGAAVDLPWQGVDTRRTGGEVFTQFRLEDTVNATVRAAWLRIPLSARARIQSGATAHVKATSAGGVHWQLYRLCQNDGSTVLLSVGRLYPEVGQLEALSAWHTAGQVVALGLLLLAVLMVAREWTRPFQRLRSVAREARENLQWQGTPDREEWDEIIETFTATIERLKASEAHLKVRFESSEVARMQLEDFSTRMVDALPQALVAFDSTGAIVRFNPAARNLPGLAPPRPGQDAATWLSAESPWAGLLRSSEVPAGEWAVRVDGNVHHFGYERIGLHDGGSLLLLHDRTPMRRLESLVAQRARLAALGETAAGLAHELRNAMGAIVGYAHLVERGDASVAREITSRIEKEASAMEEMLNRFLEVARPTEPRRVWMCPEEVVSETLSHFAARFESAGIELGSHVGAATTLWFDPFWLRQALVNLLENALTHVPGGGWVRVETEIVEGYWRLSVSDNGPGVRPDRRDKILSPFVSFRPGGTGLGLALVQKIATAHDGRVEVLESESGGARFDLLLSTSCQPATDVSATRSAC